MDLGDAIPRTLLTLTVRVLRRYVQYIQDYFIDRGNFPDKQTSDWDKLPDTAMRKLLSRIDHQVRYSTSKAPVGNMIVLVSGVHE